MFNGIVAFDVEDENAKNITENNLLKNLIGFNLVKIISSDGYTKNACIARPKRTHPIYLVMEINRQIPMMRKF